MKGYCLFDNVKVYDLELLGKYKNQVEPLVQKYGGKYIVLGGDHKVVEGNWNPTYLVMIEFPTYELAKAWYFSPEYAKVKTLRHSATMGDGVIIEGLQ